MSSLSPETGLSRGRGDILSLRGNAWPTTGPTADVVAAMGEYQEQKTAEALVRQANLIDRRVMDRGEDEQFVGGLALFPDVYRTTIQGKPAFVFKLPSEVEDVDTLVIGSTYYEKIRDFRVLPGQLVLQTTVLPPFNSHVLLLGVNVRHVAHSRFWGPIFNYYDTAPGSLRFFRAIHKASQTTYCRETLAETLGAALGVPIVQHASQVTAILQRDRFCTAIVTEHETLRSTDPLDQPIVEVGDTVLPGDTVFDSLRIHDCIGPLPEWLTQLTIPGSYFGFTSGNSLTISSTPQPAASVTLEGLKHMAFPWQGEATAVDAFNARLKAYEKSRVKTLTADFVSKSASLAQLEALNLNWLEVLWSTWLRNGVSVSLIRSPTTVTQQRRLQQVRRIVPPWLTHIMQFTDPADQMYDFC